MKFLSILAPLALTAVSAAPLEQRAVTQFEVSNFTANCKADNTGCTWALNLVEAPSTTVITYTHSVPTGTTFPTNSGFFTGSDPAVAVRTNKIGTNFRFVITDAHTPGSSINGAIILPGSNFPIVTDSTGTHQTYTGPSSFIVPVSNP